MTSCFLSTAMGAKPSLKSCRPQAKMQILQHIIYNFDRVETLIACLRNSSNLVRKHVSIGLRDTAVDHMCAYFT